jgi:FAD/FMN-containing dehydrogenase
MSRPYPSSLLAGASLVAAAAGAGALALAARRRDARRQVLSESIGPDACGQQHLSRVSRIASQLKGRTSKRPLSLRKRAVSHQVPKSGDLRHEDEKLDISDLNAILSIDPVRMVCVAEPGVTFVDLVAATMRYGLVPMVVPELKTITIGGAVSGCSLESMSFEVGGFHDTCLEYEVITARGEVMICSPEGDNALVFQMMHSSFGTLGIVSKLTFRLCPSKAFVRMAYEKYSRLDDYMAAIWRRYERRDVDFMDGIIHSPTEYALSLGEFVDEAPYTNSYDWMKVYYFFRYDRGVTNVHPKSTLGRFFFGKFMGSSQVLELARRFHWLLPKEKPTVILDVFLPFSRVPRFMAWYEQEFRYFPLWCVPYKRVRDYEWFADGFFDGVDDELFIDLAIYGMEQPGDTNYHKLMEAKLRELGGVKTLISHNYYTEEEFWATWNRRNYSAVKAITDPDNVFRDLYSKTCRAAMGQEG